MSHSVECDSEIDSECLSTSDAEPLQKEVGVQTTCTCKCVCGDPTKQKGLFHSKDTRVDSTQLLDTLLLIIIISNNN